MRKFPLIVIGAGAGGLVVAIGAAKAGKEVLLVDKGNWGGDCTNFGCIPSKSLIASAEVAYALKRCKEMGIDFKSKNFDAKGALDRVREIVHLVRTDEEPGALAKYGVETMTGHAKFIGRHTLEIDGTHVHGDKIVIATGSYPVTPPFLDDIPHLTNETIFELKDVPEHLAIIGGGPIGCELGQAFHRLGAKVSIIQADSRLLPKSEPEASEALLQIFKEEGIDVYLGETISKVEVGYKIVLKETTITASHLLVAAGRKPLIKPLELQNARVLNQEKGILTDSYGRSTQNHIYAVGDVTGLAPFSHIAEAMGRAVLFNLIAPWPFRKKLPTVQPHVTFTSPEVAGIGLTEEQAIKRHGKKRVTTYHFPLSKLDRALTTGQTEGFVKIVTKKWSSRILGACIVAPCAGELLGEISVAMKSGVPLRKLADVVHAYPTWSLAIRKTADMWLTKTILKK